MFKFIHKTSRPMWFIWRSHNMGHEASMVWTLQTWRGVVNVVIDRITTHFTSNVIYMSQSQHGARWVWCGRWKHDVVWWTWSLTESPPPPYFGPHIVGPIRPNWANQTKLDQLWLLITFFCTKFKFKGGIFLKQFMSHTIRASCFGLFGLNTWLQTSQIWGNQNCFNHFEFEM